MTDLTSVEARTSKLGHREVKPAALPPIAMLALDTERLRRLADAAADKFPRTADFLAREIERATVIESSDDLPNVVAMGSMVEFRDDTTGKVRRVTLVYPPEADVSAGKISVLTPVGAALIGLSAGQSIEYEAPSGGWRSLSVLAVRGQS